MAESSARSASPPIPPGASASAVAATANATTSTPTPAPAPATSNNKNDKNGKIYEGVFALNKPLHISSAQAIRDLQAAFNHSRLFAPWMAAEQARRAAEQASQQRRRSRAKRATQVKMGHGGTLDPLATGVLVIGVGRGTKALSHFTGGCGKEYRATLLFGAATDTYDGGGRVVARAGHAHVSRAALEAALPAFRGDIVQTPPLYSALSMDGKRLYEYAREGKEPPRKIEARPVTVERLEVARWREPGTHGLRWPSEKAPLEERELVSKMLHLKEVAKQADGKEQQQQQQQQQQQDEEGEGADASAAGDGLKRKRGEDGMEDEGLDDGDQAVKKAKGGADAAHEEAKQTEDNGEQAPAVELEMTVTSGFYVRSLCYDLGKAVGSLGMTATLERTRQGEFAMADGNVLEYEDLAKGESVWGPKVQAMLEKWESKADEGNES